ncbi:MAG TPA: carboxypeptidase regulatory-like domain-containing protein [Bacteroidia bacterium]|jgi:hypothetical protein|nr:carboxypeptidase regulatory-like domain-containing protein [Bacteroidia bacterium]
MKFKSVLFIFLLSSCATTKTAWVDGPNDSIYKHSSKIVENSKLASQTSSKIDTALTTVRVELIDPQTKETIPFACVLFSNTTQKYVGTTDIDGIVRFKQLAAGRYEIKVVHIGYNTLVDSVTILNGYAYKIKIDLGYSGQLQY